MGAVYVVEQLSTGAERALKVMAPALAGDAQTRERFVREARIGAQIDSDHVVEVVTAGVDEESGSPYLVMELLRGEELADAAAALGPLPLGDVADVMEQIGHALERAHAKGIVHRDLKPENVFLAVPRRRAATFTVKILDFGIAKLVADQQQRGTQPLGTPLYMPPEQTEPAGRITPASDVWALGLIAFHMLVGREFWLGAEGTLPMLLREIVVDAIPTASERARELGVPDKLPAGFDAWFMKCVARDIDQRFAEAGAAVRAFAALVRPDASRGVLAARLSQLSAGGTGPVSPTEQTQLASAAVLTAKPVAHTVPATQSGISMSGSSNAVAPPSSRGPLIGIGIGLALVAGGAGAFFALRGGASQGPKPEPSRMAEPVAAASSAGPTPARSTAHCPDGMQLIRGGNMFMGEKGLPNAEPAHRVSVSSFCLDRTEVTAGAYDACVAGGNCLKATQDVKFPGMTERQRQKFKELCNTRREDKQNHPINCVDWAMADNFCRVSGGRLPSGGARLPTEAEWEFAARGSSQRNYPWGDEPPNATRLNACGTECDRWMARHLETIGTMYAADDGWPGTAPVGSFPKGASSDGLLDLAGNVWEWTADWYGDYSADAQVDPKGPPSGTERVVRGGSYNGTVSDWAKPSYRWKTPPDTFNHSIGLRCAKASSVDSRPGLVR